MIRFDDRVAIVTGAGKGLGRAYALYLAERGAKLVLNNRRREVDKDGLTAVDHVVREIQAKGGEAVANYASVEDPTSGHQMVQQALDTWGRLDVLVNNAGIDRSKSFANFELDDFLDIFQVNFHGTLYVTHAAWKVMREAGYGRIVVDRVGIGHAQHRAKAAVGRGVEARGDVFFILKAGLAQVHVGVDEAGEDFQARAVFLGNFGGHVQGIVAAVVGGVFNKAVFHPNVDEAGANFGVS